MTKVMMISKMKTTMKIKKIKMKKAMTTTLALDLHRITHHHHLQWTLPNQGLHPHQLPTASHSSTTRQTSTRDAAFHSKLLPSPPHHLKGQLHRLEASGGLCGILLQQLRMMTKLVIISNRRKHRQFRRNSSLMPSEQQPRVWRKLPCSWQHYNNACNAALHQLPNKTNRTSVRCLQPENHAPKVHLWGQIFVPHWKVLNPRLHWMNRLKQCSTLYMSTTWKPSWPEWKLPRSQPSKL